MPSSSRSLSIDVAILPQSLSCFACCFACCFPLQPIPVFLHQKPSGSGSGSGPLSNRASMASSYCLPLTTPTSCAGSTFWTCYPILTAVRCSYFVRNRPSLLEISTRTIPTPSRSTAIVRQVVTIRFLIWEV